MGKYSLSLDEIQNTINEFKNKPKPTNHYVEARENYVKTIPKLETKAVTEKSVTPKYTKTEMDAMLAKAEVDGIKQTTIGAIDDSTVVKKGDALKVVAWSDPNYKLSNDEKKQAKKIIKDYYNNEYKNPALGGTWTPEQQAKFEQIVNLENKTRAGAGLTAGLFDAFHADTVAKNVGKGVDKITGGNVGSELSTKMQSEKSSMKNNNKAGYYTGLIGGNLMLYKGGAEVAKGIPVLNNLTTKAGTEVASLLGGGRKAQALGNSVSNILGDTALDVALDTIPTTIDNVQSGKVTKDTALDALKNLGTNVAFNVGGEAISTGIDALKKVDFKKIKADKQAQKELQKRVESVSAEPLGHSEKRSFAEGTLATAKEVPNNSTRELPSLEMQKQDLQNTKQAKINTQEEIAKSQKIVDDYANELKTATDKYVGMFRGNESTAVLSDGFKQSINNFVNNPSLDTLEKMFNVNSELNKTLQGNTYTYKLRGKQKVARTAKYDNEIEDILTSYYSDMLDNALTSKNLDIHGKSIQNNTETLHGTEIPTLNDTVKEITTNTDNALKSSNTTSQPTQIDSGMKLRGYDNKTIQKTDMPDDIKKEFAENPDAYKVLSNAETKANADAITNTSTTEQSVNQFNVLLGKKDPTAIPLGYDTAKRLIDEGKREEAVTLIRNMSSELTKSGQFSQAAAITMMKADPMTALRYMEREIDTLNTSGAEKFGTKWKDFELTDDEIKAFSDIQKGDSDALNQLYDSVTKRIAETYPSTNWEKFTELRKLGFLLNPRTHIRNTSSNTIALPLRSLSDRVAAVGERGYKALINPDYQVTQSLVGGNSSQKKIASELFDTKWKDVLNNTSNKWEDVGKNAIKDKRVFETGWLEKLRRFDYKLLGEIEDDPFVKKNFVNRLASYMQANKINSIDNIPEEAQIIAYQEALKATFKDSNFITNALGGLKHSIGKGGDLLLPFTKTPANLTMRSIEYSPAGIVKAVTEGIKGNGAQQVIDSLAKSVTGTSAIALGYLLAKNGIITGSLSNDKDKKAFEQQQGKQAYSIKVGDNYYSYDWALPSSAMIIMGADIVNAIEQDDAENYSFINSAGNAVGAGFNSIADQSSITNLSELFTPGQSTGEIDWAKNISDVALDVPAEMIPSSVGALARTIDHTQRVTFDPNSTVNTKINEMKAKIPFLSKTLPASYDTWGNERNRSDNVGEAALAQFVNPGKLSNSNVQPMDNEILRLNKATDDNKVFPSKASWTVDGKHLSNKEYSEYQKVLGQNSSELVGSLLNTDFYRKLPDDTRVETLNDMYTFSNALAKNELFGYDIAGSNTYKKLYEEYSKGGVDGLLSYMEKEHTLADSGFEMNSKKAQDAYENGGAKAVEELAAKKQVYEKYDMSLDNDKVNSFYDNYGETGLSNLYDVKRNANTDGNKTVTTGELLPVLQKSDYSDKQKGDMLITLTSPSGKAYDTVYNDRGSEGVYQLYSIKQNANTDGGGLKKAELMQYLNMKYSSNAEKRYWYSAVMGSDSKNPY